MLCLQGPLKAATEEEAKCLQEVLEALEGSAAAEQALEEASAALRRHQQKHAAELQHLEAIVGAPARSPRLTI